MIHRAVAPKGAKRGWVLDADLKSAFDKIDHKFLLERLGTFPAREQVRAWLKAGVVDKGRYSPTGEGTLAFGYEPSLQDSFLDGTGLLLRRVADGRAVWLLLRLRFVRPAGGGGSWHREARVICRILSARAGPGVPASRRGGAGPGWRVHGQAAGGAFGCPGDAAAGSGSRCSRAAAGTACPLLRVLTFLMVNRG